MSRGPRPHGWCGRSVARRDGGVGDVDGEEAAPHSHAKRGADHDVRVVDRLRCQRFAPIGARREEVGVERFEMMGAEVAQQDRTEVRKDGKCSTIFSVLEQRGKAAQNLVLENVIISIKVKSLESFLKSHFESFELIESVNTFFRYKLPEGQKISKLFGELERNQEALCLSQYSVKQTTIEQIFINFANQAEHHED